MCRTCGCDDVALAHVHTHDLRHPHVHAPGHVHDHEHGHGHEHDDPHVHVHGHPQHHAHAHANRRGRARDDARLVRIEQAVLAKNDQLAARNRAFFESHGVLALNLTSSPGAGKTTLLERTIRDLSSTVPVAVIEGDQETENDAERIRATGCRAVQINTGAGCHLDAERVGEAVHALEPARGSVVFIENVGNLVCPAMFDLGERAKVVVLSVTEGEDKPAKYPHMFRAAEAMVLSKTDLLPHLDFDVDTCLAHARRVNPKLRIFPVSVRSGDGLAPFYAWVREQLAR